MEIIGKRVEHSVFGEGIVSSQSGKRITISFKCGEKRFTYPDVFRHFCTVDDEQLKEEIQQALLLEDRKVQQQADEERERIRSVQDFRTKYKIKQ